MPRGAEIQVNSLWYKKGLHDRIYYHNGEQWIVSTLTNSELITAKIKSNQYIRYLKCQNV